MKELVDKTNITQEYAQLKKMGIFIDTLLNSDAYIAKSDYRDIIKYQATINFFEVLSDSGMLESYCKKNKIKFKDAVALFNCYKNIEIEVKKHNEEFITKHLKTDKKYLDNVLKSVDKKVLLDENQRRVVLSDEDYSLVIAGAGAGKTTTVAAKAKYLVDKKGIDPKEILIVSFTNKAVNELRERINRDLKLDCIISTFHSIGYAIINSKKEEKFNIVDSDKLFFLLSDYFKSSVLSDEAMVNKLVLFFSSYLSSPQGEDIDKFLMKLSKEQCTTLRSDIDNYEDKIKLATSKQYKTINNEILRSYQEVKIANFLYLNGIEYQYEPIYKYNIKMANKPYTPDFIIKQGDKTAYIEHFGLNEDGTNFRFSEKELVKYKKAIKDKIKIHKEHKTDLLYTFSSYKDHKDITEHLKSQLIEKGFVLKPISKKEVLQKIVNNDSNKYIFKLINLLCRFINNFKTNGCGVEEFDNLSSKTSNVRDKLFLDIAKECYLEYERYLKSGGAIDFEDMINDSSKILNAMKNDSKKLRFKYAIVDEYQDISKQRFDLVSAIRNVSEAKIIAVGDDWQSIYAFSGSNIKLFTDFKEKVGYCDLLKIETTYRNSQEIIDIAGNFIQKNKTQISKALKSPKHIIDPVLIFTYEQVSKKIGENNKSGTRYNTAKAVELVLDEIHKYEKLDKKKCGKILVIGRFGFDRFHLEASGVFEMEDRGSKIKSIKYPKDDITFMTAHSSKGLGFDNVIVINGINGTYGFPSKIENDPVLRMVINEDDSYDYAEERRLFYVALTRTKNRVYFIAPKTNPSEFLLEIKNDNKNIKLIGDWNDKPTRFITKDTCPICGYPLQYRYNRYGLALYICMNEPEVCGFMSNNLKGQKMQIMKCDCCKDGYMIVKKSEDKDPFLGCTNYKQDKTGCNNSISMSKYYEDFKLEKEDVYEFDNGLDRSKNRDMTVIPDKKYNSGNLKKAIKKDEELKELGDRCLLILSLVNNVSKKKYYSVKVITNILIGEQVKNKYDVDFTKLKEFNSCAKKEKIDIEATCLWLIENKYLRRTKGLYPVLHPTNNGGKFKEIVTANHLKKLKQFIIDYKEDIEREKNS